MRDPTSDYYKLVELLGQSNCESVLHALAEGKTGNCEYDDFLPVDIVQKAETALYDFIKALENYKANEIINDSLAGLAPHRSNNLTWAKTLKPSLLAVGGWRLLCV